MPRDSIRIGVFEGATRAGTLTGSGVCCSFCDIIWFVDFRKVLCVLLAAPRALHRPSVPSLAKPSRVPCLALPSQALPRLDPSLTLHRPAEPCHARPRLDPSLTLHRPAEPCHARPRLDPSLTLHRPAGPRLAMPSRVPCLARPDPDLILALPCRAWPDPTMTGRDPSLRWEAIPSPSLLPQGESLQRCC